MANGKWTMANNLTLLLYHSPSFYFHIAKRTSLIYYELMSLEREGISPKQVQLLYPSPDISLSVGVHTLLDRLEQNNALHIYNEKLIIATDKKPAKRTHIATGKSVDVTEVVYGIFDARNGLENFAAKGMIIKDRLIVEEGIIFEYATFPDANPLKRPHIDTARTLIKKTDNLDIWQGSTAITRNEYDDLALIRKTDKLFTNLPSEKDLSQQMRSITEQIAVIGNEEGYKVSLKILKKGSPPQKPS
jgi:hypothetical protein